MGERLTEEQVRRRVLPESATRAQLTALTAWVHAPSDTPIHHFPVLAKGLGVRWTGTHYEEAYPDAD